LKEEFKHTKGNRKSIDRQYNGQQDRQCNGQQDTQYNGQQDTQYNGQQDRQYNKSVIPYYLLILPK
jgi:hypothetical protein